MIISENASNKSKIQEWTTPNSLNTPHHFYNSVRVDNVQTNLSALSPSAQIVSHLLLDNWHVFLKPLCVQSVLEHLLLLQKHLQQQQVRERVTLLYARLVFHIYTILSL